MEASGQEQDKAAELGATWQGSGRDDLMTTGRLVTRRPEAKAKRQAQWAQAMAEALLQAEALAVEAVRELEAQRTVWAWWRLLARRCSGCGGDISRPY